VIFLFKHLTLDNRYAIEYMLNNSSTFRTIVTEFDNATVWKLQKQGDIAEFNPETTVHSELEYVDLASVTGITMLSHRNEERESATSRAQQLVRPGDIFYATAGIILKNNYLYNLPYSNYVFLTAYAQLRPSIDSYFLFRLLQNDRFVT
jgi:type I restriction enzyme S subunit